MTVVVMSDLFDMMLSLNLKESLNPNASEMHNRKRKDKKKRLSIRIYCGKMFPFCSIIVLFEFIALRPSNIRLSTRHTEILR